MGTFRNRAAMWKRLTMLALCLAAATARDNFCTAVSKARNVHASCEYIEHVATTGQQSLPYVDKWFVLELFKLGGDKNIETGAKQTQSEAVRMTDAVLAVIANGPDSMRSLGEDSLYNMYAKWLDDNFLNFLRTASELHGIMIQNSGFPL